VGCPRGASIRFLFGLGAVLTSTLYSRAEDSTAPIAQQASSMTFNCAGQSEERSLPHFASRSEAKFEVSATFGEGSVVALVDPETGAVRQPLYDAESTSGTLRLSGVGDGDVLALTIDTASPGTSQRAFTLFAAASASLVRGTCIPAPRH
jgi:hypothetical protein